MTKKQMMALKPGDIVVEKTSGDEFVVVELPEVRNMVQKGGKFEFINPHYEIGAALIPGFEYSRRYVTNGPYFYFTHTRMKVKEDTK